jgi:hypothetical protein
MLIDARERRGQLEPALEALGGSFCSAVATAVSRISGTSARDV